MKRFQQGLLTKARNLSFSSTGNRISQLPLSSSPLHIIHVFKSQLQVHQLIFEWTGPQINTERHSINKKMLLQYIHHRLRFLPVHASLSSFALICSCILFWMGYNWRGRKLSQSRSTHFLSSLSERTCTPQFTPSLRNNSICSYSFHK
jgi:hypothetical protein